MLRTDLVPRRRRDLTAGLTFHVVNRAAKRALIFERSEDYAAFQRTLTAAVHRFEIALFAYCLMPNHWHLLLSPFADGALSRFMHWLTMTHAMRWQQWRQLGGQGAVYQGRYKAIPVANDQHFLWVSRYVERNPLRARLVVRAEDWEWSSLHARQQGNTSWLAEWPVPRPFDWVTYVQLPQTEVELERFQTAMRQNQPFGDEVWTRATRDRLGINEPRGCGRPRGATTSRCRK